MTTKADQTAPDAGADEELLPTGAVDEGDDEPSIEDLALEAGWTPKEKWKGDPGKWVSAAEHLRRTAKSQKTLAKKLSEREEQLAAKEKDFDDRIKRLEATSTVAQKREIAQLKAHYQKQLDEAIESKDPAAIRKALNDRDEAIEELEDDEKPEISDDKFVENFRPMYMPVQKPFWTENSWLLGDDEEAEEAFAEIEEIVQDVVDGATEKKRKPTYEEMERAFAAAERHLKRAYKHRLGSEEIETPALVDDDEREEELEPKPKPPASKRIPVLAPGSRTARATLASRLPAEAIKAADEDIKRGLFADREEYAKVYFSELGEKV